MSLEQGRQRDACPDKLCDPPCFPRVHCNFLLAPVVVAFSQLRQCLSISPLVVQSSSNKVLAWWSPRSGLVISRGAHH